MYGHYIGHYIPATENESMSSEKSEIKPTFAARIDFEMFQNFVIITPLYPPREAGNFEIPSTFQRMGFCL